MLINIGSKIEASSNNEIKIVLQLYTNNNLICSALFCSYTFNKQLVWELLFMQY